MCMDYLCQSFQCLIKGLRNWEKASAHGVQTEEQKVIEDEVGEEVGLE